MSLIPNCNVSQSFYKVAILSYLFFYFIISLLFTLNQKIMRTVERNFMFLNKTEWRVSTPVVFMRQTDWQLSPSSIFMGWRTYSNRVLESGSDANEDSAYYQKFYQELNMLSRCPELIGYNCEFNGYFIPLKCKLLHYFTIQKNCNFSRIKQPVRLQIIYFLYFKLRIIIYSPTSLGLCKMRTRLLCV